jgi:GT2 family glycosyltransferase
MLLSIVTLNYKKPHLTIACMASLQEQFKKEFEENQIELLIVDNHSEDDSLASLKETIKKEDYKNTRVIANDENAGFGKGCNVGAKEAKGEYLLFLNNDTLVKDKGILAMAKYLEEKPEIAILGGQLRNSDGTKQPSTGKFYTPFYAVLLLLGLQKFGFLDMSPNIITQVDWVKGGLLMVRAEVFKKLAGFDEKIFMYIEDMELCYRAHLSGYKTFFYPDVMVAHEEHGSTNRTFAIVNIYQNLLYFYKKHRSPSEYRFLHFIMKTKAAILVIVGKILGNSYLSSTYEQALKAL